MPLWPGARAHLEALRLVRTLNFSEPWGQGPLWGSSLGRRCKDKCPQGPGLRPPVRPPALDSSLLHSGGSGSWVMMPSCPALGTEPDPWSGGQVPQGHRLLLACANGEPEDCMGEEACPSSRGRAAMAAWPQFNEHQQDSRSHGLRFLLHPPVGAKVLIPAAPMRKPRLGERTPGCALLGKSLREEGGPWWPDFSLRVWHVGTEGGVGGR